MKRLCSLREAVRTIPSGSTIAFGGFQLNRAPMALVRELIRQKKKRLRLLLLPNPLPLDFLIGAKAVGFADVAFAGLELDHHSFVPPNWQAAVTSNGLRWRERDAIYLVQGLRAGALGVPFLPLPVSTGPARQVGVAHLRDPFHGGRLPVVEAVRPDVALLHAQAADLEGNLWIKDPVTDELVARASRRVISTAERILRRLPQVTIPSLLVHQVVKSPGGAWPTACAGSYREDHLHLDEYLSLGRAHRFRDYAHRYIARGELRRHERL